MHNSITECMFSLTTHSQGVGPKALQSRRFFFHSSLSTCGHFSVLKTLQLWQRRHAAISKSPPFPNIAIQLYSTIFWQIYCETFCKNEALCDLKMLGDCIKARKIFAGCGPTRMAALKWWRERQLAWQLQQPHP